MAFLWVFGLVVFFFLHSRCRANGLRGCCGKEKKKLGSSSRSQAPPKAVVRAERAEGLGAAGMWRWEGGGERSLYETVIAPAKKPH